MRNLTNLTARERDVALLVSKGLRNKSIARQLQIGEGTVKMHLHHIYSKLAINGRVQLALLFADIKQPAFDFGVPHDLRFRADVFRVDSD